MPLVNLLNVSVAFGLEPLLDVASLQIESNERVCLIGRNGTGKSTLLSIVAGETQPDSGEVWRQPGLRIARLAQELPQEHGVTVFHAVADAFHELGRLLTAYHEATLQLKHDAAADELRRVEALQHELEARDGWLMNQRVDAMLTRLELPPDAMVTELSGGWRRRVALARTLVGDPELLLLDEPTNHLDIEAIQWLEEQLLEFRGGLLFVTHDRALLQRLATRIVELDRGRLTSWSGDYLAYREQKAAALEVETRQAEKFDRRLAQEESWIRQGIKARRTRNEGRVRALEALREARRARRTPEGRADFGVAQAERSGQLVIEAQDVAYSWQDQPLIENFSVRIMRGDRIGLIGPNGSGKTSLLRILLSELLPQEGDVRQGTRLRPVYFDQLRSRLDPEKTVLDNVSEGRETVSVNGRNRHIISYLGDFLFTPARVRTPVRSLSGGERNRVLLARLFSEPSNLLVMDEPTNDLDMETLELLEELLIEYKGTLLLVSHDRAFLNNVVSSCLVFEGLGQVTEYVGGYDDWLRQARPLSSAAALTSTAPSSPVRRVRQNVAKLSYKEQRELDQLPARIEALEAEQSRLQHTTADPAFYRGDPAGVSEAMEQLRVLAARLEADYRRWDELENLRQREA